jgi:hypothetical protein
MRSLPIVEENLALCHCDQRVAFRQRAATDLGPSSYRVRVKLFSGAGHNWMMLSEPHREQPVGVNC